MDWGYRALGIANKRAQAIERGLRRQKDADTLAAQARLLARGIDEAVRTSPDTFGEYGPFDSMSAARAVVAWLQAGGR
jgi:hypothetical protein